MNSKYAALFTAFALSATMTACGKAQPDFQCSNSDNTRKASVFMDYTHLGRGILRGFWVLDIEGVNANGAQTKGHYPMAGSSKQTRDEAFQEAIAFCEAGVMPVP